MLQQILQDMYIEPELLEELSEDQKQVLFYKMREEQVRRWKLQEEQLEQEENKKPKKPVKEGQKQVGFLKGKNGCEWVWVMGEHPNDKSIEQILDEEAKAMAQKLADAEAEAARLKEEAALMKRLEAERQRVIKEKAEHEAEMKRKQEEAELYKSVKEARLALQKMQLKKKTDDEENKRRLSEIELTTPIIHKETDTVIMTSPILNSPFLSEEEKQARRRSREVANSIRDKRSSEIFTNLQKKRQDLEKQALAGQKEVETSWQEQEKKSKEAEIKRRETARQARTEYRESLRRSMTLMQAADAFAGTPLAEGSKAPVPPKRHKKVTGLLSGAKKVPRPAKPENRQMIVDWFVQEEKDRVQVLDPGTKSVVPWFHGIINRADSEKLLLDKQKGSFLVRVSERVWGYTLSYRSANRCKHFLVDASESGYQFIGADQSVHESLAHLVNFHKDNPVTISGQEKLLYPCGQTSSVPDFSELFRKV